MKERSNGEPLSRFDQALIELRHSGSYYLGNISLKRDQELMKDYYCYILSVKEGEWYDPYKSEQHSEYLYLPKSAIVDTLRDAIESPEHESSVVVTGIETGYSEYFDDWQPVSYEDIRTYPKIDRKVLIGIKMDGDKPVLTVEIIKGEEGEENEQELDGVGEENDGLDQEAGSETKSGWRGRALIRRIFRK